MRPASALSLNQDSHEARAEEDEQGNVHVNESGGRGLGREHMGEVREALTISCQG